MKSYRHCRNKSASRSRGLCWACYYCIGVRDLYPTNPAPRFRRLGVGQGNINVPVPSKPTDAALDSAEKITV